MDGNIFGTIVFGKSDWETLPKNIFYKISLRSDKTESDSGKTRMVNWKTGEVFSEMPAAGPRNDSGPGSTIIDDN